MKRQAYGFRDMKCFKLRFNNLTTRGTRLPDETGQASTGVGGAGSIYETTRGCTKRTPGVLPVHPISVFGQMALVA